MYTSLHSACKKKSISVFAARKCSRESRLGHTTRTPPGVQNSRELRMARKSQVWAKAYSKWRRSKMEAEAPEQFSVDDVDAYFESF